MTLPNYARRIFLASALAATAAVFAPAHAAEFKSDRIGVTAEGSGKDVILIPGMGSSPRVWTELVKAVPGYRYHFVQVNGFAGHPVGGNAQGTVAAPVAAEIARYIAAQKLDKPAVIGHSMGGTMGMMLAARHPGAISKLMVVDMLPFMGMMFGGPGATPDSVKPMADAVAAQIRASDPAARQARTAATIASMVDNVAMRQVAMDDSLKSDVDVTARAFHELIVTDLAPELTKIAVPTRVLYVSPKGVNFTDEQIDAGYKAAFAPLAGASLKRITSSAHFIMWDQPAQFQAEVRGFLGQAKP